MFRDIPFNQLGKAGYNRGINRAHVNNIKRNFCPDMVQPAIVSWRDGKYWIIDHQHQSQAIYELNGNDPNTLIKCDVRTGLTYEQEAELYYRLNTSLKKLTFADELIGLIEAKDPTALEFRALVESCGYVLVGNSNKTLKAVTLAMRIYSKAGGADRLRTILTITQASWPNNPKGVDSRIIDGLNYFVEKHENEFKMEECVKSLSKIEPQTIINQSATIYKNNDSRVYTRTYCTYVTIVKQYNTYKRYKLVPAIPGI